MKPKRHPYSGFKNSKKMASGNESKLVAFPNIAINKGLLKYIYTVVREHDSTIICFRIPKPFGYETQRAKINLSYEATLKILNRTN